MKAPRRVAALIAALCVGAGARASEPIRVGGFAPGLGEWRLAAPATRAAPPARARKWEGVAAAELVSRAEMVMLARPLAIDVEIDLRQMGPEAKRRSIQRFTAQRGTPCPQRTHVKPSSIER